MEDPLRTWAAARSAGSCFSCHHFQRIFALSTEPVLSVWGSASFERRWPLRFGAVSCHVCDRGFPGHLRRAPTKGKSCFSWLRSAIVNSVPFVLISKHVQGWESKQRSLSVDGLAAAVLHPEEKPSVSEKSWSGGVLNLRTTWDTRFHRKGRPMPETDISQASRIARSQNAFTDKALDFQRPLSWAQLQPWLKHSQPCFNYTFANLHEWVTQEQQASCISSWNRVFHPSPTKRTFNSRNLSACAFPSDPDH